MSSPAERHRELYGLLQKLSDGPLAAGEAARLNELLHGDPEACEIYLDHLTLDAHLRHEFGSQQLAAETLPAFVRNSSAAAAGKGPKSAGRLWRFGTRAAGFAAAAILGALVSLLWLQSGRESSENGTDKPEARSAPAGDCVATLLFADNCQWARRDRLVEGQRLGAGALYLERGLAVLRFDGGAAVVLEGPAEFGLESRGSARLASGRITVRAPDEAAGFTVHTPASEVVDLGTEFAVMVERTGATEVHVLEGEVTYSKPGTPPEMADLLAAGQAVRYDQARTVAARTVPLNAPRFSDLLRQAKIGPREDLLLAHEGFDYPVGRLALADADGGTGWAGPWRMTTPGKPPKDPGDLTIAFGKLNVPWPLPGGRGPMLEAPPEYQSRVRTLAQPVRLDEDGVYYVSALVRWEMPPVPAAGAPNPAPSVRLVLRSSADFQGDHVMFNLPGSLRPQLDIRSGAIFTSGSTVAREETQFWVGKIVARRQGEDEMFFRVYGEKEPLDAIEPGVWSIRSRGVQSDAHLDLVVLSKFGGGSCWWDEIRVGKSWRAVVPASALARSPK